MDDEKIIPPQGIQDESGLTEDEQKAKRIFEITGAKKTVQDIVREELEKKEKAAAKLAAQLEKEENPMSIDDIPAYRGGIFSAKASKIITDRMLASGVRRLTLKKIFNLLCMDPAKLAPAEMDLYSKVLVKLAGSVLPRIQEITGEDGEQLTIHISKEIAMKNKITGVENADDKLEDAQKSIQEEADQLVD